MKIIQKNNFPILIILLVLSQSYYIQEGHNPTKIITKVAFGSNYYGRYAKEEDIFQTIITHKPDLWIWLGNSVYLNKPKFNYFNNNPNSMDWDLIKILYQKVKDNKYYKKLAEKVPVIGTWGEEEYGISHGDEKNSFKESYKQYYLDFLDVDILDQRRNYPNMGIYSTYSFGSGYKTVRFILLDLQYNKNIDMLGKEQWDWIETIFQKTKETFTFICVSNQILSFDKFIVKNWYLESRKKLFDLIGKYKRNGVIFLSGGLGFAQILKTFCPLPEIGYNLYECTSSGLSHTNKFSSFLNNLYKNDYLIDGQNFDGINFGQVKINWGEGNNVNNSYIELEIYDKNDNSVSGVRVNYTELIYQDTESYYLDQNNLKNIRYMSINNGTSCEVEIHHRIRNIKMISKYYLTSLSQLPIALITAAVIIILGEIIERGKKELFLLILIGCFGIYCISYLIDIINYNNFVQKIKS